MQISTAISEIFVILPALYGLVLTKNQVLQTKTFLGIISILIAATLGIFRFTIDSESIITIHYFFAKLAGQWGLPMVALGLVQTIKEQNKVFVQSLSTILLLGFAVTHYIIPTPQYGIMIGALANLAIFNVSMIWVRNGHRKSLLGIFGPLIIVFAGLKVGTTGMIFNLYRVDIFHFLFGIGLTCIFAAHAQRLQKLPNS